jgi:hypothetical protein
VICLLELSNLYGFASLFGASLFTGCACAAATVTDSNTMAISLRIAFIIEYILIF